MMQPGKKSYAAIEKIAPSLGKAGRGRESISLSLTYCTIFIHIKFRAIIKYIDINMVNIVLLYCVRREYN